jgi:hypothetical protein
MGNIMKEERHCKYLETCEFFKKFESNSSRRYALSGFVNIYCKGDKREECVRMRVSKLLGMDKVPVNMMPNGYPISGTDKSEWSLEVIRAVDEFFAERKSK